MACGRWVVSPPKLCSSVSPSSISRCSIVSSSPPSRFYALSSVADAQVASISDAEIMIGPFEIPGYLDRGQIVTRGKGSEIEIADFDRWAEPLQTQIQRVVAVNVNVLLGIENVVEFPLKGRFGSSYKVVGRIQRFEADRQGNTVLEVQWGIVGPDDGNGAAARRDRYEAQAKSAGNYDDIVAAMNQVTAEFSEAIAKRLAELGE